MSAETAAYYRTSAKQAGVDIAAIPVLLHGDAVPLLPGHELTVHNPDPELVGLAAAELALAFEGCCDDGKRVDDFLWRCRSKTSDVTLHATDATWLRNQSVLETAVSTGMTDQQTGKLQGLTAEVVAPESVSGTARKRARSKLKRAPSEGDHPLEVCVIVSANHLPTASRRAGSLVMARAVRVSGSNKLVTIEYTSTALSEKDVRAGWGSLQGDAWRTEEFGSSRTGPPDRPQLRRRAYGRHGSGAR